jgi:hypothetical protein
VYSKEHLALCVLPIRGQLLEESALKRKARSGPNVNILINIYLPPCLGLPDWPKTTTLVDTEESRAGWRRLPLQSHPAHLHLIAFGG